MKIPIKSDVFDIVNRLCEIDHTYFVVFDTKKQKFELHSSNQPFGTYCLTIPYECLDERTITLALKTRSQNKDALIAEMEQNNQKIQRSLYGS